MQDYQREYIENCRLIRKLTVSPFTGAAAVTENTDEAFEAAFADAMQKMGEADELARRSMELLEQHLMPQLDDLFAQTDETLAELEAFADELTAAGRAFDIPLAIRLHEALLSVARKRGERETIIRELYKLGMARYALWSTLTGLNLPSASSFNMRMRYCFVEASSYLKYFEEFSEQTQSYILRATANIYLGHYDDWRERLDVVRHTMLVFTDVGYRRAAPNLPWDSFLTAVHRQMISVIPHTFKSGELTPDAVADVMEAAHLIYEDQINKTIAEGGIVRAQVMFSYYSLEFRCGLITMEQLLNYTEELLDSAEESQYDQDNAYKIVSLPAFYAQYLSLAPEFIEPRRRYLSLIYYRAVRYIENLPHESNSDAVQLYVRQILSVFIEGEDISYRELAETMLARFSPELYAHGYTVGMAARAICETIADGDPSYFDDIPEFAALSGEDKRRAVGDYAYYAGIVHDLGKINFTSFLDHPGRRMLASEYDVLQLHSGHGASLLKASESTRGFADVAAGHHRWYDSSGGYPEEYNRRASVYRAMVDVVSFADYMDINDAEGEGDLSFDEKLDRAIELSGRRFSPLVTGWLRTPALLERLRTIYENGRREGYHQCFKAYHHTERRRK